jgi:hypothetical protein
MTAAAALARAHAAGLALAVAGDRIHWRGPRPPEDLLAELLAHKPELLALLAESERPAIADALLAAAERGAAAVAAGPADDIEAAEAEAIRAEADEPATEPAERHRELIRPFLMAALLHQGHKRKRTSYRPRLTPVSYTH